MTLSSVISVPRWLLRRRPGLRLKVPRNQTRTLVEGDVGPTPLQQDHDAIAETDEENNVHEQPREPRGKSTEMHQIQISHCFVAADCGHTAFVEIPKALRLSIIEHGENVGGSV